MDSIIEMKVDLEMLKSAFSQFFRQGPITHLDAQKGYRFQIGKDEDGSAFLSPWIPHPEDGKSSVPLKKNQIVGVFAPSGDMTQGLMIRGGYSNDHPSPSDDMEANVFEDAGVRVEVCDGTLTVEVGGVVWVLSEEGQAQTGGRVTHNEINIGDDHEHKDVIAGPDLTGPPVG